MPPCTAVNTGILYNADNRPEALYRAEIVFVTMEDLVAEITTLKTYISRPLQPDLVDNENAQAERDCMNVLLNQVCDVLTSAYYHKIILRKEFSQPYVNHFGSSANYCIKGDAHRQRYVVNDIFMKAQRSGASQF